MTVAAQPSGPSQLCNVSDGTGSVASANITMVSVRCGFGPLDGEMLVYSIDATTGVLTPKAGSPFAVTDTFLYVGTRGGDSNGGLICAYAIDASTRSLTPAVRKSLLDGTDARRGRVADTRPQRQVPVRDRIRRGSFSM